MQNIQGTHTTQHQKGKQHYTKKKKKWAEDLNRHFPKKTYRWPNGT